MNEYCDRKLLTILVMLLFIGSSIVTANETFLSENNGSLLLEKQSNSSKSDFSNLKIRLFMKLGNFPSLSACIIKNNSVVWYSGYGFYNIYRLKKPSIDTVYMIASITKTFTATAMMQLYEQGKFGLDDNVSKWLPFDLKNPKYPHVNITFRMLLSHQSSLAECELKDNALLLFSSLPKYPKYPYPWIREYLLPNGSLYKSSVWLDASPGTKYNYSNFNYVLLEYLLEKLSNQSIEEYCKEHILVPLKMLNTSFHFSDFDKKKLAVPYIHIGGMYLGLPQYDPPAGVGGLRTSVRDLSHFLIAHINGGMYNGVRILNESTIKLMHTIQYPNSNYGLGWSFYRIGETTYQGHGGAWPGCDSNMIVFPSGNVGLIFFMNKMVNTNSKLNFLMYKNIRQELLNEASDL